MVKHTQTVRRQKPTNYLSVFDHFVGLALKGLKTHMPKNTARYPGKILQPYSPKYLFFLNNCEQLFQLLQYHWYGKFVQSCLITMQG